MYRKCTTEISVRHQRQVEDALLGMMLTMPYADITVTALCEAAGITRRIFSHLFPSKTDALQGLIDHTILGIEGYRPDITDQVLRFCFYWRDQAPLLEALRRNNIAGLLLERLVINVLNEDYDVRYWLKDYDWDTGTDIIIFYLSGIMGLTYGWYHSGYRRSPEDMAHLLSQLVRNSLPIPKD